MKVRAPVVLLQILLVVVLGALPPLAHASVPDPTWIAGIYDAADFDDVIVLITSATGDVSPAQVADLAPILEIGGSPPQLPEGVFVGASVSPFAPRGPPTS